MIRVRTEATVSDPVGADVIWIKAAQISGREDEVSAGASGIGIDVHALSRAGGVGERVSIVMVRSWITKDRTRVTRWTGLRNTAAEESISLCGIGISDASGNRRARR